MSTISSLVYLNNIEPQPLSLRVPSGIETRLDMTFLDQLDAPITTDLLAQIELTPRSQSAARPIWIGVPAVDVYNGRAMAVLPANSLTDPAGYQLRLYGTVSSQQALLAIGMVDVFPAIGPMSTPLGVIDSIALTLERGEKAVIGVKLWTDTAKGQPFDITNSVVSAAVYAYQGGPQLVPFTVAVISSNEVQISLTANQVDQLPDTCWWSLISATTGAGMVTLAEGKVTVTGTVMVPFAANFNYLAPDEGVPLAGEIVHQNFVRNVLLVSTIDADGLAVDLSLLGLNDTITIDTQTWTIRAVGTVTVDAYEFLITPLTQVTPGLYSVAFASGVA